MNDTVGTEELKTKFATATRPAPDDVTEEMAREVFEACDYLAEMSEALAAEVLAGRKRAQPVTDDEVYAALSLKRGNEETNRVICGLYREREAGRERDIATRAACRDFRQAWQARPGGMTAEAMALRTVLKRDVEDALQDWADAQQGGAGGA